MSSSRMRPAASSAAAVVKARYATSEALALCFLNHSRHAVMHARVFPLPGGPRSTMSMGMSVPEISPDEQSYTKPGRIQLNSHFGRFSAPFVHVERRRRLRKIPQRRLHRRPHADLRVAARLFG